MTGPGTPPSPFDPVLSGGAPPAGTRQIGETTAPTAAPGGSDAGPVPGPEAVPGPSQTASDPIGTANEAVGTAQSTVNGLIDPHR